MNWTEVAVLVDTDLADAIGAFLVDHGAPGLQLDDVAQRTRVTAHFSETPPLAELKLFLSDLQEMSPSSGDAEVTTRVIEAANWAENWKEHFPPLLIGDRLFVHPPWITEIPAGRLPIVIDPGMAFGTGHHGTTSGCLILLESEMKRIPNARVLDLGCGSGVLAIAAVILGAREVVGVDIDPEACEIAVENIAANGVGGKVRISTNLTDAAGPFDIVLANILARTLIEMAAEIAACVRPGGSVIGSGTLTTELSAVLDAWRAIGLSFEREHIDGEWTTFVARRTV